MSISELINEIVSDWAYRVNDGMPNPNNPKHIKQLEIVLSEIGLGHVKSEILQSLNEAEEGGFTNPALNKKVRYKNAKGEDKEGIVGNLLRQPEDSPGRKAAEAALPPEGSPERDAMNQELGSEKDGKAKAPEDEKGKEGEDGKDGGAAAEDEKKQKAAAMFDPKADPAMGARLDREKAASDKLAQKDKEDAGKEKDSVQAQDDKLVNFINKDFDESPDKDFEGMSDADVQSKELEARWKNADAIKEKGEDSPEAKATKADWAKHMVEKSKRRGDMENAAMWDSIRQDNDPTYKPKAKANDVKPEEPTSTNKPDEKPTGPVGGPNAEPPMDEPSKPDTTPPTDTDVPDVNSPNDVGLSPKEKYKKAKEEADRAAENLKAIEKLKKDHPEQFATPEKQAEWEKNKEILATKKDEIDALNNANKVEAEKKKKLAEPIASELKNRKTSDGEELDVETTDNGSMIIGVEHGEGNESTKQTIESIQKLPKDTKVMFVGEGGMSKDTSGNLELSGEQAEIRDAVKGHFDNAEEGSWDENANVNDENSPVFDEVAKSVGGSKSKSKAAIWSNMVGQGDDMNADDYLDDEGKQWIIDQAKKAGATNITDKTDFSNLTDAEKKDLYELNYNDEGKMGDNEIMKGQEAYNGFRQKELDRKIKEAEDNGYTVVAPVGNSHVDMWRQRNKSQQNAIDTNPEDKPEETPKEEPKAAETPKATKDDIKNEKPGKEAKTDNGGSLYSVGGGYYSDKPNGPAKYVRTESILEMAFDNSLNEDVFALFEKSITGTLQNGEKITVQELPPRAVKKATQRAKAAAASSKEEPTQQPTSSTEKPTEAPKADNDTFNPIDVSDVSKEMPKANTDTFSDGSDIPDAIDPKELEQFNTDINKVAQQVADAKSKGEKAPDINLCDVTVPGTNLYCDDNLGIPRDKMPQFKGKAVPGSRAANMPLDKNGEVDTEPVFKKMLDEKGIKVLQTEVPADKLKATQSELGGDKVVGMMGALEKDPNHPSITAPIYVSRDGFVIDGHHRWAAIVAYNAQNPDNQIPMKTTVVDMDIKDAIPMCNKFAEDMGIAAKKQGETTGKVADTPTSPTSMPPEAPADAPAEEKSWFQRQRDKVIHGIKKWTKSEKEFFDRGGHKPGSEPRRNFGQMLLDKAKGVGKAIVHGLKHEAEIFSTAGRGIYEAATNRGRLGVMKREDGTEFHWKDVVAKGPDGKYEYEEYPDYEVDSHGHAKKGPDGKYIQKVDSEGNLKTKKRPKVDPNVSEEDKKLFLKSYNDSKYKQKCMMKAGKAILITGVTAALGGGLAHGAVGFLKHVAVELVPHVVGETIVIGAGKAAIFAGAAEMNMQKHLEKWGTDFMEKMADTMANKKIPIDVMAKAVESYNKEKENTQQKSEMKIEALIKEIISEINLEAKGETFTAIKKDTGMTSVFKSKEARDAAIKSGTHKMPKASKETPKKASKQNMFTADAEYQKRLGKEKPSDKPTKKVEPTPTATKPTKGARIIGGKDKTLAKVDTLKSKEFNQKQQPDDVKFAEKNKKFQIGPPPAPYKLPKELFAGSKVPPRHLKALERMMNTKATNETAKWSHFSDLPGGAGQISAQAGELMTMISTTLDDKQAAAFFNSLLEHEKQQIAANPKLKVEGSRVVGTSWIKAAVNNRRAIRNRLAKEYPGATIEAGSWDTQGEVEAMGLVDYKKNKGFSTDAYFKIKTKDGQEILDEVSLKKSTAVNFLNSGTGKLFDWDPNIPDDINPNVYSKNQRKSLATFGTANIKKLQAAVANDPEFAALMKSKKIDLASALAKLQAGKGSRDINKVMLSAITLLAKKGDKGALKYLQDVQDTHKAHQKAVISALGTNPKLKQGMLTAIREEFPLKAVGEGEESMAIGPNSLDRAVLQDIFQTSNFDEIKQGLFAVTDEEPPYLAYRAGKNGKVIPIATIVAREDGVGYGGQIKFEMQLDKRFAKILEQANKNVYGG